MTALIAAMNKRAVAMAADSAVTIDSTTGHKVLNSANKLFCISPDHPVGIMTCGNATYMGLPWEVIIKEFRKTLVGRKLQHLEEYQNEFLNYILSNKHFSSEKWQTQVLQNEFLRIYSILEEICASKPTPDEKMKAFDIEVNRIISDSSAPTEGLKGYSYEDFKNAWRARLDPVVSTFPIVKMDSSKTEKMYEMFYHFLIRSNSIFGTNDSQIVFAGYGEDEIMPHLTSISVWFGFDDRIRFTPYIEQHVAEDNAACISRYAQTDIINTFINGINPQLQNSIDDIMPDLMSKFLEQLSNEFKEYDIQKKIKEYDTSRVSELFKNLLGRKSREQFVTPLINTIALLDSDDLAIFTESLVSLTSLNRRMLGKEEGVGGPIDVAVIAKGEGFKWIKCKS